MVSNAMSLHVDVSTKFFSMWERPDRSSNIPPSKVLLMLMELYISRNSFHHLFPLAMYCSIDSPVALDKGPPGFCPWRKSSRASASFIGKILSCSVAINASMPPLFRICVLPMSMAMAKASPRRPSTILAKTEARSLSCSSELHLHAELPFVKVGGAAIKHVAAMLDVVGVGAVAVLAVSQGRECHGWRAVSLEQRIERHGTAVRLWDAGDDPAPLPI